MKLRKVTIDGKTYYEEICEDDVINPEIVEPEDMPKNNASKQDDIFEDKDAETKQSEENQFAKKFKNDFKEFMNSLKGIGNNISKGVTDATKNWFVDTPASIQKTNKLVKILPFMNKEDVHDITERILKDDLEFKGVDYAAIMPFMSDEDCDALFMKALKDSDTINIKMVHFVSKDCLSCLVDAYVSGKYKNLDVDALYPFLDSKDVKKLFYYELNKK